MAVVYSVRLLEMLDLAVRFMIDAENMMTSVERVITYTQLDSEPGYMTQTEPPENWPNESGVRFENLSLVYYSGGPQVLKNLSFSIEAEEKIGIVGRTGAGKSSLVAALLRMPEPAGLISLDGLDVQQFNLPSYRSRISVIPQDPILFSGMLRANLDPTGRFKDSEVWNALEAVHMRALVSELEGQLYYRLTEGGSNFSAGQRQLLCLARALLQGNRMIVLDEATANVDLATDALIQDTIRTEFKHCTVLTIAHRVSTILDYDRVMVLERGSIVECDKPDILLKVKGGKFAELCRYHHITM